jgi:hypothetical protein
VVAEPPLVAGVFVVEPPVVAGVFVVEPPVVMTAPLPPLFVVPKLTPPVALATFACPPEPGEAPPVVTAGAPPRFVVRTVEPPVLDSLPGDESLPEHAARLSPSMEKKQNDDLAVIVAPVLVAPAFSVVGRTGDSATKLRVTCVGRTKHRGAGDRSIG